MKTKYLNFICALAAAALVATGCSESETPTVFQPSITDLTYSTAVVQGLIFAEGSSPVTRVGVCYALKSTAAAKDIYYFEYPAIGGAGVSVTESDAKGGTVRVKLTGLKADTLYYVRMFAENAEGITYSYPTRFSIEGRYVTAAAVFGNGLTIAWRGLIDEGETIVVSYTGLDGRPKTLESPGSSNNTNVFDFKANPSYAIKSPSGQLSASKNIEIKDDKRHVITGDAPYIVPIVDYDIGGEGIAYHDNDENNNGGSSYRKDLGDPNNNVDISNNPYNIGWTDVGEWLKFTLEVKDAGDYEFDLNVTVNGDNVGYTLEIDGTKIAPKLDLLNNGSWGDYRWHYERNSLPKPVLTLTKGVHEIKYHFVTGSFNISEMKFTLIK
jgi:hypothetical protein